MKINTTLNKNYFKPYIKGDLFSIRDRLIGNPKEFSSVDERGHTIMNYGAFYGQYNVVKELFIAGYQLNNKDRNNKCKRSSLIYATIAGHNRVVELILNNTKQRRMYPDIHGNHAVMYSLNLNNTPKTSWNLLRHYLNVIPSFVNNNGVNILHIIVKTNNILFLEALQEYKGFKLIIKSKTKHGFTALSIALLYQSYDALKFLFSKFKESLPYSVRDIKGNDPFMYLDKESTLLALEFNINIFLNSNLLVHFKGNDEMLQLLKKSEFCTKRHIEESLS